MGDDQKSKTDEYFIDLESRIIEQEHRLLSVVKNFIHRKKWKDDKRRKAATIAFLYRLLFTSSVIVVISGGILISTMQFLEMRKQNNRIDKQNHLLESQNEFLRRQIYSDQVLEISSKLYNMEATPNNTAEVERAFTDHIRFNRAFDGGDSTFLLDTKNIDLSYLNLNGWSSLKYQDFAGTKLPMLLYDIDFTGSRFKDNFDSVIDSIEMEITIPFLVKSELNRFVWDDKKSNFILFYDCKLNNAYMDSGSMTNTDFIILEDCEVDNMRKTGKNSNNILFINCFYKDKNGLDRKKHFNSETNLENAFCRLEEIINSNYYREKLNKLSFNTVIEIFGEKATLNELQDEFGYIPAEMDFELFKQEYIEIAWWVYIILEIEQDGVPEPSRYLRQSYQILRDNLKRIRMTEFI